MTESVYSKYAKFILNEIKPRAKRNKLSLCDLIPSDVAFHLFCLEIGGKITRRQTREFLDYIVAAKVDSYYEQTDNIKWVIEKMISTEVKIVT